MFSMVYATAKDEAEALRIAHRLVEERLVACANVFGGKSVYRWEGKVVEEPEAFLIMKTRREKVKAAVRRLKELHSYTLPCAVSYAAEGGDEAYLRWVDSETR